MSTLHDSLHPILASASDTALSHLWLSTIILAAALVIASLPRLSARTRYFVIFIAVAKFALPATLLIRVGEGARARFLAMLGWQRETLPIPVSFIFDSPVTMTATGGTVSEVACTAIVIWAVGAAAATCTAMARRWLLLRTVFTERREATEQEETIFAKLRAAHAAGRVIRLGRTTATTAPAAVGVLRPAILLPEGSSESLSDRELEGVLIHEIAHIERRDNLTGLIHTLLCSLFWFHPLLWIANRRLLIERERACDEAVLDRDVTPAVYVSGVLKICRGAAGGHPSAVACMRNGKLKERMDHVMRYGSLKTGLLPHQAVSLFAVSLVIAATVAAASLSAAGPAPSSDPPPYSMRVSVIESGAGTYMCDIEVLDRSGRIISAPRLQVKGGEKGVMTISSETRHIEITSNLNERGSGPVTLEVRENDEVVTYQTVFAMVRRPGEPTVAAAEAKPMNLHLREAELQDVLKTFAMLTGEKFSIEPGLSGKVSAQMTDVPWTQALAAVLDPLGMTFIRNADGIRVVPAAAVTTGYVPVGGDIRPPRVIRRVEPIYPGEARKARIAGLVIIEAAIDAKGDVVGATIVKDLPYGLGAAARDAVRQWKFDPATKDGVPVPVLYRMTISFRLDDENAQAHDVIPASPPSAPGDALRVGGNVRAPRAVSRVEPQYPKDARTAGVEGVVILEAVIDEAGRVVDVRVLKGLPHGLDEAAADAVRQWIFEPATQDGRPVRVLFNLTINFKLDHEVKL